MTQAEEKALTGVSVTAHVCDVSDVGLVEVFRDEVVARHKTESIDLLFKVAVVMPGVVSTGIFTNSLRQLGAESPAPDRAGFLSRMGVESADISESELEQTAELVSRLFVTTPSEAATIILEALRTGRRRILVCDAAPQVDDLVAVEVHAACGA